MGIRGMRDWGGEEQSSWSVLESLKIMLCYHSLLTIVLNPCLRFSINPPFQKKSSQAKNGGAYFSAVCGLNSVPISATEGHEHRVCNRLLGFYPPGTFVLPHTCTHHPLIHGRCQQYLFRSRSIGFVCWEIQSTCFWTNTAGNAHGWADDVCMCGAKQKYLVNKNQAAYCRLGAHGLL